MVPGPETYVIGMDINTPSEGHGDAWRALDDGTGLNLEQLYRNERAFRYVWVTLRRLGVAGHLLEDATHDVFLVVLRRRDDFRGDAKISSWLFGIARRIAYRYRRTATRQKRKLERLSQDPCAPAASAHGDLKQLEARSALRGFMAGLEADALELFIVCELEDRSTREAAEILGRNPHTLARHRRHLRSELVDCLRETTDGPTASLRRAALFLQYERTRPEEPEQSAHASMLAGLVATAHTLPGAASAPPAMPSAFDQVTGTGGPAVAVATTSAGILAKAIGLSGLLLLGAITRTLVIPPSTATTQPLEVGPTPAHVQGLRKSQPKLPTPSLSAIPTKIADRKPAQASTTSLKSGLDAELELVARTRRHLDRAEPHRALRSIANHRRRFPRGLFTPAVIVLEVRALCDLGQRSSARAKAMSFVHRHPNTVEAEQLRNACPPPGKPPRKLPILRTPGDSP